MPLPMLSISCCFIQRSSWQRKRPVSGVFRKDKKHKEYESQVGGWVDRVAPGACYFLRNSCKSSIMPQNNGFQRFMTILCFSRDKLIAKLIYKTLPCSLTWRQIPHFGDIKTVPKMLQLIFLIQAESNSLICWVASEFSCDALHCVSRELKRRRLHHKLISEKEVKWWNNITIITFLRSIIPFRDFKLRFPFSQFQKQWNYTQEWWYTPIILELEGWGRRITVR